MAKIRFIITQYIQKNKKYVITKYIYQSIKYLYALVLKFEWFVDYFGYGLF